jgi:oxygen-dependent protoporphyrinogen oxidase
VRILILGGGISGLSAAWYAKERYPEAHITLFEASDRLGGFLGTEKQNGFSFERGARTFSSVRSPRLRALLSALGLESELLFSDPSAERRFLWERGKLRSLPSFWPLLLQAFFRDAFAISAEEKEESIFAFAKRRFGKRFAETLIDPMVLGIFGGDMRKLSLQSTLPFLAEWEAEGSVLKGWLRHRNRERAPQGGLFRLREGMGSLIQSLEAALKIEICLSTPVEALTPKGVGVWGREVEADLIVSALPIEALARCAGFSSPVVSSWLQVVNLGYGEEFRFPHQGYGYLVPTKEKEALLGMVWDSAIFPALPKGQLTAMVRGEEKGSAVALEAMGRHLGYTVPPQAIWVMKGAIPQYEVGHRQKIFQLEEALRERFPRLRLTGNYLEGVSVEACLARSSKIFTIS